MYAQKELLPKGCEFKIEAITLSNCVQQVFDPTVQITWLDYKLGDRLSIQLQKLEEQGLASTKLSDGTLVLFQGPNSEEVQKLIQAEIIIQAQIIEKCVANNFFVLFCISRACPPRIFSFEWSRIADFPTFGKLELKFTTDLKAKITNNTEDCMICYNSSDILFYACSTQEHAVCYPCLKNHIHAQLNRFNLVNPKIRNQGQSTPYQICLQKDSIPSCMSCRQPLINQKNISVRMINNDPIELIWLTYKIDDIIQFKIQGLMEMPEGKVCILGELPDETIAAVNNLNPIQAITFQAANFTIHAKISSKTIENGKLYLNCEFVRVSQI